MVRLRALVVADQESKYIWDYFDRSQFQGIDVILSCGDLKASYLGFLATMIGAPLLYVPGNHDGAYLTRPPEGCEDLTLQMAVIKGVRFIGFGGVNSLSPKPFHYAEKDVARQVVRRIPQICAHGGFDVLVTHAPARGLGDGEDSFHRGFRGYLALLNQYEPRYHFHGHQHDSYPGYKNRLQHGRTTVVNAFGYRVMELEFEKRRATGKLSYIKARVDWGRTYGETIRATGAPGL